MSNNYYNNGGFPATGASASSAAMRAELALIAAGFSKLPALTGNGNKIVVVDAAGVTLTVLTPPVGALVGTTDTQTLTNKTISGGSVTGAAVTGLPNPVNAGDAVSLFRLSNEIDEARTQVTSEIDTKIEANKPLARYFITDANPLSVARSSLAAASLGDGRVLVCGGYTDLGEATPEAEIFNPGRNTWTTVAPMPTERGNHAAAPIVAQPWHQSGGRVLVCGGEAPFVTATALVYDSPANLWASVASMPTAKIYHAAAPLLDGRVLVCGGTTASDVLSEAHIYYPDTNTWTAVAPMPEARIYHAAATLSDGRVLVCGGGLNILNTFATAFIYSPGTNTWTTVAPMPTTRAGHVAVTLSDGRVLVSGGGTRIQLSGLQLETFIYSPNTDTWTTIVSAPTLNYEASAAPLSGGRVLVCGGRGYEGALSEAFIYNPTI